VIRDGKVVGVTTSGNFSYTLGKSVGYAYLPLDLCDKQGFVVESFTEQSAATRHDGPLYDPKNERLKA
jgi:4-methylaminobutanoate oxidase (formaldehyde-forming)